MMKKTNEYIAAHFDGVYSAKPRVKYSFDIRKMGPKDRKIVKYLLNYGVAGKRCLDIGPGTGRWLTFLKTNGADYLGAIDISQQSLERCSGLCDKTQQADIERDRFDFESDFFDITTSFEVLEHLKDPDHYIREMIRVTKSGGMIMMSTPNIVSFASRVRMVFGIRPVAMTSDKTHVRFHGRKDITGLFSTYDVKPVFISTSFSLNPKTPKSRLRVPLFGALSSLDDSLLFVIRT